MLQRLDVLDVLVRSSDSIDDIVDGLVSTLSTVTPGSASVSDAAYDPADIDEVAAASRGLRLLTTEIAPWLQSGPLTARCTQRWIATASPPWRPPRRTQPSADVFSDVQHGAGDAAEKTPSRGGIFTSTSHGEFSSMWQHYLEGQHPNELWPRPWHVWETTPPSTAIGYEVRSARDWADLVGRHHVVRDGHMAPDWNAVAGSYDYVHFAVSAVVALQGFRIRTAAQPIAAPYWDSECTFWMRWLFGQWHLVAVLD